jgi:hypothetical protein
LTVAGRASQSVVALADIKNKPEKFALLFTLGNVTSLLRSGAAHDRS